MITIRAFILLIVLALTVVLTMVGCQANTPSTEPTVAVIPRDVHCCMLPEGVFQTIWKSDRIVQTKLGCPAAANPHHPLEAFHSQTAYQPFQHGAMLWATVGFYATPKVIVLYADGSYEMRGEEPTLGETISTLGLATAAKTQGEGQHQMFVGGNMIWVGHRQETYILFDEEKTYTVVNSPTFTLPTPTPDPDSLPYLLARWKDASLSGTEAEARREFAFLPDGTITFYDCTGIYELIDGRIHLNSDGCTSPELTTGVYEYAFDSAGERLTLRQRFSRYECSSNKARWERQTGGELALRPCTGGWCTIDIDYRIEVDYPTNECPIAIEHIDCSDDAPSPLAPAIYGSIFVGPEWILSRHFVRSAVQ